MYVRVNSRSNVRNGNFREIAILWRSTPRSDLNGYYTLCVVEHTQLQRWRREREKERERKASLGSRLASCSKVSSVKGRTEKEGESQLQLLLSLVYSFLFVRVWFFRGSSKVPFVYFTADEKRKRGQAKPRKAEQEREASMGAREAVGEEAVSTTASLAVAHANKQGLFHKVADVLGKVANFLGKPASAHAASVPGQVRSPGGGQTNWAIVASDLLYMGATLLGSLFVLRLTLSHLDPNRAAAKQAKQRKKEIKQRLGRSITTNTYEDVIACDVINPDHLSVSFDRIGGLQTIKERLFELVILPLRRPDLFARGNLLKPVKGVLLYGPPGTGKTMLAKAIAKESNASFINVRAATLQSKWFGDAQKLVTAVFTLALKLQPSIIFIDEIDSMLGKRHSNEHEAVNNMKTEFMALWDGFTTDEYSQVMVLGATNRPWEVDEAVLRRLPQSFLVGLPDENQRIAILSKMLEGEVMDESFYAAQAMKKLGKKTAGYSGSDLKQLCTNAAYYPIRELLVAERKTPSAIGTIHPRSLTMEDFIQALDHSKPTGAEAMKYMKTKVLENSYNQLGMYFNQELDEEANEEEDAAEDGKKQNASQDGEIKAFDPLKMFKNSK